MSAEGTGVFDPSLGSGPAAPEGTGPGHYDGGGADFEISIAGVISQKGFTIGYMSPAALAAISTNGITIDMNSGLVTQRNGDGTTSVVGHVNRGGGGGGGDGYVGTVTIGANEQINGTDLSSAFNYYTQHYHCKLREWHGDWRNRAHWDWRSRVLWEAAMADRGRQAEGTGI